MSAEPATEGTGAALKGRMAAAKKFKRTTPPTALNFTTVCSFLGFKLLLHDNRHAFVTDEGKFDP